MAVSVDDPSREQRRRIAASALDGKLLNAPPPSAITASRSAIDESGAFPVSRRLRKSALGPAADDRWAYNHRLQRVDLIR